MLKVRVIPTLLYRDFGLVKGVRFDSWRHVGGAMQAIKVYNMRSVDEIAFLDVAATPGGSSPDFTLIDDLADDCFMPMAVGGGVRSVDDFRRLLQVGADKVVIGTAAVTTPDVVAQAASRFGSQCVVVAVDTATSNGSVPTVRIRCGREDTGRDPVAVASELEALGAGEVLLTSIDQDGTMEGYDLETLRRVCDAVSIPVIASGGAGSYEDMTDALVAGASAVAAASIFLFTHLTPMGAKEHLRSRGVPVRL
ncbi:MAG: imidazole glycerol phosphate synthase subunit HisF [Acidimicrobiales bacterium]